MENTVIKIQNEFDLHTKVVDFIRKFYVDAIIIPGLGEFQTTGKLRCDGYLKGYTPGQPDLLILNSNDDYEGFAIEFKTPKGKCKTSENQEIFLSKLKDINYKVLLSNDYDEIIIQIINYFK
jgi:hypothetical protein